MLLERQQLCVLVCVSHLFMQLPTFSDVLVPEHSQPSTLLCVPRASMQHKRPTITDKIRNSSQACMYIF